MVKAKKASNKSFHFTDYNPQRGDKYIYDPTSTKVFKLSRSKLVDFLKCSRCFYIDRRLGTGKPTGPGWSLNIAVDGLLKKEFDQYRAKQIPHPLCIENGINAIPFKHEKMDSWRKAQHEGVEYAMPGTNLLIHGGVDDVWIDPKTNELIVVDYKSTAKYEKLTTDDLYDSFKYQAEIYQWLLRKNGFSVSNTAYFFYCNGKKDLDRFDNKLIFDISILPYQGNDAWIENAIMKAYQCLNSNQIPQPADSCDYCMYWGGVRKHVQK